MLEWHTGSDTFVRPSMGSWITYGLGSENQNFPGYVTICQDFSQGGANNFGAGFLPAVYQGTTLGHSGLKPREAQIPFIGDGTARRDLQRLELDLIARMERREARSRGQTTSWRRGSRRLSWPSACKTEAPEMQDISRESKATQQLYRARRPGHR